VTGAKAAYQQAIDSGDADITPEAARSLKAFLSEQGDAENANASSDAFTTVTGAQTQATSWRRLSSGSDLFLDLIVGLT